MGTKRPSWTLFDTLMNISMSDHRLQPGGKVSRDPSPRPAMTVRSEQESDGLREENWRKENEAEKMRDKTRYRDMDAQDRYRESDRSLGPRLREGEREMWERDRRKEDGRSRNGKLLLNVEKEFDQELERRAKKGGTFPRFKKSVASPDKRLTSNTEIGEERGDRRQKDRPKRAETDAWEQEKERAWQRARERDEVRSRGKEEGKTTGRRYMEHEKVRQKERYQESDIRFQDSRREVADSWDRRERMREKPMPDMGEREVRMTFPHRRKDIENNADRKEIENAQRREKRREIRSEGNDERELRRERVRDRDGEELMYQYSRSEGDNMGKMARERDRERQRYRVRDREREVDRFRGERTEDDHKRYSDGDRRAARPADREGKESRRDVDDRGDRKVDDQYREYRRERNEKRKERQGDNRRVDRTDRISQSPTEHAPRVPPRTQSSGEWSSDPDIEIKSRRDRGGYEEQESRKEGNFERDRERPRDKERTADKRQMRNEKQESDKREKTGSMPEQRRMWLEPQRGKNSKGKFIDGERHTERKEQRGEEKMSMESQAERGRDGWRIKEEPDERYLEQSSYERRQGGRKEYREDPEREQEGESVDEEKVGEVWREKGDKEHLSDNDGEIEESLQRDEEGDVIDDIEGYDREDEGGTDYWARSESEGGSEAGWKKERDEILSPEDGFVTLSSGGEDEREDTEEEFRDCQEFQEGGAQTPVGFKGYARDQKREEERTMGDKETADGEEKYVFVVGKALPQSQNSKMSSLQVDRLIGGVERSDPNLEIHHHLSGNATERPPDDLLQTLNRNDEHPMINNQDTESEHKVQREERLSAREAAEGNIQSIAPSDVYDAESSEEMRSKVKHLYSEMGIMKSDTKTERLLKEWRQKNNELTGTEGKTSLSQSDLDRLQPILDQINSGTLSPEEVEAIRIKLSATWSMSEEPKRHSQAPHLRWAKDVVREILGHSEDEPSTEQLDDQPAVNESEISNTKQQEEVAEETREVPVIKLNMEEEDLEPELEELYDVRGMGHSQAHMHADQFTVMHVVTHTHTHADTALDSERKEIHSVDIKTSEPSGQVQLGESDIKVTISEAGDNEANLTGREKGEKEEEMFLNADNPLYKPNSCPSLYYESDSDLPYPSSEGESQGVENGRDESEERRQVEEPEEMDTAVEVTKIVVIEPTEGEGGVEAQRQIENPPSSRILGGSNARSRRRGIRKTTQRRNVDVEEEEEGVGRDRRTRVFYATDDEDDRSKSWGEVGLRALLGTMEKRRKNSKFFSAAQLYQQYSEAAQNFEILRQARSETLSVCDDTTSSPLPSPPPARRPLPPIPPQSYFHSLSHTGSIQNLPLPERPRGERRASSPRLSISQSSSLWRDLPGVRDNAELEKLTDDERRLQEVRFEVITSEASYCRSLEIVVTHFVKSKSLGALLTTQEKNWLFSRLVDVRAISHSFLSKLEERVESDVMHFTVCDIINAQCALFRQAYVPYLTNQSYQDATYQRLMNENPRFKMAVEKIEKSTVCQRLPLRSFLVLPFQRITRLKLLVQNIVKRTTPGTEEATQAIKALKHLEKIIQEGNDSITQMKSIESLVSLNSKVDFECRTLPLISQSRRLVREGPVTELMDFSLKETERSVYLHLFNDCLLLSLPKEGGRFTVIDHCLVSELRVENCRVKLHSLQKNLFRLHMTQRSLLLRTAAPSDKARWISALSRPHPEIDFSAAQDFEQMQCIRAYVAQQPDELSLEKADVILVHPESSDNWIEGTRLSDRHRGWVPKSHLETIISSRVKKRNLMDAQKLTAAKATV